MKKQLNVLVVILALSTGLAVGLWAEEPQPKEDERPTTTILSPSIRFKAKYADTSYWRTSDKLGSFSPMDLSATGKGEVFVTRISDIFSALAKVQSKTEPEDYYLWVRFTAKYPDGREATKIHSDVFTSKDELFDTFREWIPKALKELRELGGDDT